MRTLWLPADTPESLLYTRSVSRPWRSGPAGEILGTNTQPGWRIPPICRMDERLRGTDWYYPYVLQSAYYWHDQRYVLPKDTWAFGDSGGFSIATLGAKLDPLTVIRWQIQNTNAGCLLDVPPYNVLAGHPELGGYAAANFDNALAATLQNTKQALPLYLEARERGTAFRWWGVLQGQTPEQQERWRRAVTAIYPFDGEGEGWAVKAFPNNNPAQLARCFRFVRRQGWKNIHLLQATGVNIVTILHVLGHLSELDFVTYDSSSHALAAVNHVIYRATEDHTRWSLIEQDTRQGRLIAWEYMLNECECWSCGEFRKETETHEGQQYDRYRVYRKIMHNFGVMRRAFRLIEEGAGEDPEAFLRDRLGRKVAAEVLRAFDGREVHRIQTGTPRSMLDGLGGG